MLVVPSSSIEVRREGRGADQAGPALRGDVARSRWTPAPRGAGVGDEPLLPPRGRQGRRAGQGGAGPVHRLHPGSAGGGGGPARGGRLGSRRRRADHRPRLCRQRHAGDVARARPGVAPGGPVRPDPRRPQLGRRRHRTGRRRDRRAARSADARRGSHPRPPPRRGARSLRAGRWLARRRAAPADGDHHRGAALSAVQGWSRGARRGALRTHPADGPGRPR